MKQQTLAMAADQGAGFEQHRRPTRREEFLATMNEIVPSGLLLDVTVIGFFRPIALMLATISSNTRLLRSLGLSVSIWSIGIIRISLGRCSMVKPPFSPWHVRPCGT